MPARGQSTATVASSRPVATASFILALAAIYNVAWGIAVVARPEAVAGAVGLDLRDQTALWQCIGMLVATYGLAYWLAARDPFRLWPIVLVGLVGKVLGPVGSILTIRAGLLPATFAWINVTNDLLWIPPFAWILWQVRRARRVDAASVGRSLYARLLGADFDRVTPQVRAFHAATEPIEARGTFAVERGAGRLANRLADLARFPPATPQGDVRLRVTQEGLAERWERDFGSSQIASRQWEAHGLLAERLGPLVLFLRPRVDAGALVIEDVRATLVGMPWPPFAAPRVQARGIDDGDAVLIEVDVSVPLLGRLVRYSGRVRIVRGPA